jgi:hypothetical protein
MNSMEELADWINTNAERLATENVGFNRLASNYPDILRISPEEMTILSLAYYVWEAEQSRSIQ